MSEPAKNPFNKDKQEAEFLTWDHGYNSRTELDNPYDKADEPGLHGVWARGFRANKSRPKEVVTDVVAQIPSEASDAPIAISAVPTEVLELELKKRKLKELQSLNQQASQLEKQLQEVQLKINRLNVLVGD